MRTPCVGAVSGALCSPAMGSWAAGPFGNDKGLDYVGEVVDGFMSVILDFLEQPRLGEGFEQAFAAVALLNILDQKVTVPLPSAEEVDVWKRVFLTTLDSQPDAPPSDKGLQRSQRRAVEKEFDRLLTACRERVDSADRRALGTMGRRLLRAWSRRPREPFTLDYRELAEWATGFDDDIERAWNACPRGDWLIGLATALGVPVKELLPAVATLVSQVLPKLPPGEPRPAEALRAAERWVQGEGTGAECAHARNVALVAAKGLGLVPAAAARAAAALADAAAEAEAGHSPILRDSLTAAVKEYALVAQLEAGLAAEAAGKEHNAAMLGDGSRARDAASQAAAPLLRAHIPWATVRQAFAHSSSGR
ncbi:hypothetical protein [Hyalangium rubrum]|uniref:Uncharacterized protein n=1 Tax=Hyalangium rubrum TaxID=3103134 RepID=A0ABU5HH87_9BACT|nr:hypothetical protein [Hyalangium sp. s54d21]MDY7232494.1 hypothetical protein [Hyalangium sp. s54d21]